MKTCLKCGKTKDEAEFYRLRGKIMARCKECVKEAQKLTPEQRRAKKAREKEAGYRRRGNTTAQMTRWKASRFRWRKSEVEVRLDHREQCPKWADTPSILLLYRLAKNLRKDTGLDWTVDHIVPLRGENVTGLHTHDNLQVILRQDNLSKSNRF